MPKSPLCVFREDINIPANYLLVKPNLICTSALYPKANESKEDFQHTTFLQINPKASAEATEGGIEEETGGWIKIRAKAGNKYIAYFQENNVKHCGKSRSQGGELDRQRLRPRRWAGASGAGPLRVIGVINLMFSQGIYGIMGDMMIGNRPSTCSNIGSWRLSENLTK